MSRRFTNTLVLVATLLIVQNASSQASMQTLLTNGATATRLNIVFLSEGYTTNELAQFPIDASAMLDYMLNSPPLNEYSNFFNAFAISVPSNESGSDHYTPSVNLVDTYFNSQFDTAGIQRLLSIDSTGQARALNLLAQFMPEYDIAAIVVNDPQYGGSGGSFLVSSVHPLSPDVATHEFGHTFSGLGDEYTSPDGTPSEKPNTTAKTNLNLIKWNSWIPAGTPIPTPEIVDYFDIIGLFRGAAYTTNYFRPKYNCKMRTLGTPFCEVCGEALVKSIYTKSTSIESYKPSTSTTLKLTNGLSTTFNVATITPSTHSLSFQWYLDNIAVSGATSAVYTASGFDIPAANSHFVRVDVTDPTTLVRTAPTNILRKSVQWLVSRTEISPLISSLSADTGTTLSWPATAAGLYLEQADDLSAPAWTPLLLISNQPS